MPDIRMFEGIRGLPIRRVIVSTTATTEDTLVGFVPDKSILGLGYSLTSAGIVNFHFRDLGSSLSVTQIMKKPAGEMFVMPFSPIGWFKTTPNNGLNIQNLGAATLTGTFFYAVV